MLTSAQPSFKEKLGRNLKLLPEFQLFDKLQNRQKPNLVPEFQPFDQPQHRQKPDLLTGLAKDKLTSCDRTVNSLTQQVDKDRLVIICEN